MTLPPFASLKTPILLLLAALCLAAAGIVWTSTEDGRARAAVNAQQAALDAAHVRQRQGEAEARLIAQHLDAYHALVARGFIGAESRLAWIEAVHLANQDAKLYGLTYTLSPRTAAAAPLAGGLPLKHTRMLVRMSLLVETDLSHFFAALQARAPGIVRVDRCRLIRTSDAPPQALNRPELGTECELLWFTVATDDEGLK